jgi:hypothetical protein
LWEEKERKIDPRFSVVVERKVWSVETTLGCGSGQSSVIQTRENNSQIIDKLINSKGTIGTARPEESPQCEQLLPAGEDGTRARWRRGSAAGHEFRVSPAVCGWEDLGRCISRMEHLKVQKPGSRRSRAGLYGKPLRLVAKQ